ncbi:hypothetical protein MSIBF_A3090002 [groundwater metagenome]|uniref:Uncharacterized protein n=1 Tax=groundwater metagenome TaxID=717931 RepID=A0A098EBX2_9ZZZZ
MGGKFTQILDKIFGKKEKTKKNKPKKQNETINRKIKIQKNQAGKKFYMRK